MGGLRIERAGFRSERCAKEATSRGRVNGSCRALCCLFVVKLFEYSDSIVPLFKQTTHNLYALINFCKGS